MGRRNEIVDALYSRYSPMQQEPWITRMGHHADRPQMDLAQKPPPGSPQALLDALYASGQLGETPKNMLPKTVENLQHTGGGHPQVVVQSPPGNYESQRLQEEPRVYGLPPIDPHYRE